MVSTGGPDRDRGKQPAPGLDADRRCLFQALGFIVFMVVATVAILGAADIQRITAGQDAARRATSECEKSSDKKACQSMMTGIRAVVASEEAVRVSIWQSFFSAAGLAGLGFTVWYARRTWVEAQRSADADNANLAATKVGIEEARHQSRPALRVTEMVLNRGGASIDFALSIKISNFGGSYGFLETICYSRSEGNEPYYEYRERMVALAVGPSAEIIRRSNDTIFNQFEGNPMAGPFEMVGQDAITVDGFIVYSDVAGTRRKSGFNIILVMNVNPPRSFGGFGRDLWYDRELEDQEDDGSPSDADAASESRGSYTPVKHALQE